MHCCLYTQLMKRLPVITPSMGCVEWSGARVGNGYGQVQVGKKRKYVHRLSLEWSLGRELLPHEQACHTCDNPACYNPHHLWVGSRSANRIDCLAKGRGNRKLSDRDIKEIRDRLEQYEFGLLNLLAAEYGVHKSLISQIKRGKVREVS